MLSDSEASLMQCKRPFAVAQGDTTLFRIQCAEAVNEI